jgi:putrescine transport system substrate-binding protein
MRGGQSREGNNSMSRANHSPATLARLSALFVLALLAGCGSRESPPAAAAAGSAQATTEEPLVNFANFIEEISPQTLPAFTHETGIRVNYDTYETNLALESRLVVGSTGLDVVVPGNNFLERQIDADVYQPLDRQRLPNLRHLDPRIVAQLEGNDTGNVHAVPYLWGTTSFGYNVRMVEAALGGPAPDSWALVFDPKYASRLATCGISAVDSPWLMVGFALMYLGRDPNSESLEDLADAMEVLMAIRPYLREITAMPATSALVNGDICVAISPSADFRAARDLARETGRDVEIRYVIPKEGATLWIDTLAIPKDAPHPANAHRLIDYLMRPDVIAEVTKATFYPNANSAANELLPPEIRNDPMVYPDASAMGRLHMNAALSEAYTRAQNREFTRFKTGR